MTKKFLHVTWRIKNICIEKEALSPMLMKGLLSEKWRPPTLPHCIAVPSAQAGLTSLFGMGRGGTPPP